MKAKWRKYFAAVLTIVYLVIFLNVSDTQIEDPKKVFGITKSEKITYGFKLQETKSVPETGSTAMLFEHIKSGAKLLYLKNNDIEKSFGIGFRTPTVDNTGVNHILEHSVLDGSKNYPVKSPFLQMSKQSLKTYLNAMTFPDFTLYPVASKNDKDFQNLMQVYLDAVFFPNIYSEPNIFKQEGWRYELESEEGELKVNGIVYNEMKGQYSSPKVVLDKAINRSLFPDTSYQWSSGGDPDEMMNLSRVQLLETHKKFYTPSNSCLFLYGQMDLDPVLKFIDEKYLGIFDKQKAAVRLAIQEPFNSRKELIAQYGVSVENSDKNKTCIALNFVTEKTWDKELNIAMEVLSNLLMGVDASPLKKALLESNLGENVSYQYNNFAMQPVFSIILENTEEAQKEKFEKVVRETLNTLVKEGFDRQLVKSLFNYYEFEHRASKIDTTKGIGFNISAMKGWIYGDNPLLYLESEETIAKLKGALDNRYFENIIQKYLLENNHASIVILKPVKGLEEEKSNLLKQKLSALKASMDEAQISNLLNQTLQFKKWQETPDRKEDLQKIPTLALKDVSTEVESIKTSIEEQGGSKIIFNNVFTHGISNVRFYFDAARVPQEKLPYLTLLTEILGRVSTGKYDYQSLSNEILMNTGDIGFSVKTYTQYKDPKRYQPKMILSMLVLEDNLPKGLEIAEEIMSSSLFDDKERFRKLLEKRKTEMEAGFLITPRNVIVGSLNANITESGKYSNQTTGLVYYRFICDIYNHMDEKWDEIVGNMKDVKDLAFNKEGLIIEYTGGENGFQDFSRSMKIITDRINNKNAELYKYDFQSPNAKEGFILPVKTMDVIKGGNFITAGYAYSGKMKVLQKIINDEYLWQQIRVKGGAYGGAVSITEDGKVVFLSYRDPNVKETLDAFDDAVEYLKDFNATEEEMANYIIGTLSEVEPNLNPIAWGTYSTTQYLRGIAQEDRIREKTEILSTTAQDIREYAKMMEDVLKQGIYYAAGSEDRIRNAGNLFSHFTTVLH